MTTPVFEFPKSWYQFSKLSFQLRSVSQTSARTWSGGNNVYGPHAQFFMPKLTVATQDEYVWPAMSAFFSRLGGQAGLLRIGDAARRRSQFNRSAVTTNEAWSDGTFFSDGTAFLSGLLPPTAYLIAPARRGAHSVKIGGLPPSTPRALRRGDLIELRLGGIATAVPHLYEIMVDGGTDASGHLGIEIRPGLRTAVSSGDQVILEDPTSVFHLVDDQQAEIEITAPMFGDFGFNLVEAIENA